MKRTICRVALGVCTLLAMHGVLAATFNQTVTPVAVGTPFGGSAPNWTVSKGATQQVVFMGSYSATSPNEAGLGIDIAYDPTKFSSVVVDQPFTKCLVQLPSTVAGATNHVKIGWADTSYTTGLTRAPGWPGTADDATNPCILPPTCTVNPGDPGCVPQPLYTANRTGVTPPVNLFRVTATLAAGFTSGTSTISITAPSFSSAHTSVSDSNTFTAQNLIVTGGVAPAIAFTSAASRKTHGAAGDFDIPIVGGSLTAGTAITVEPRSIGTGFKVAFLFTAPPTSATVATTAGSASVAFAGNEAIVTLTGVPDATRVRVDLTDVNGVGVTAQAFVGYLLGDVNGSRGVNSTDILTVKAASGSAVTAANAKSDLNASGGTVNSTDILTVKASSTHTLP